LLLSCVVPGHVATPADLVWVPVVDGDAVIDDALSPSLANVPILLGRLENEARYFIKPGPAYPREALLGMAGVFLGRLAQEGLAALEREGLDTDGALDRLFTAAGWTEPALQTARHFAARGRPARRSPAAVATQGRWYSTPPRHDKVDRRVPERMQQAWISLQEMACLRVRQASHGLPSTNYGRIAPGSRTASARAASP